jgi:APA family basic amino acid/polyamine antiporter
LFPLLPILGIVFIIIIASGLDPITWLVFLGWMAVGMTVYFTYSRRHSVLGRTAD